MNNMFVKKRKELVRILINSKFSGNVTANSKSSDSAITLFQKCVNFPKKSSVEGVWNAKLGYCKNHPLKQLFF